MPLQDSDNFIIGRGTDSYKITYQDLKDDLNYVPPPVGTINTPTVTEPNDGAGGGDTRYLKSDAITDVEGGGVETCETDLIQSVNVVNYGGTTTSVHPNSGPVSVLFNGEYVGSFTNKNIGSSVTAARGLIEFTPPVMDAAFVGHFSGNVGIDFDVEYVDGSTQKVDKVGLPGYAFEETPLENASGVARIRFYAGNGVNSEWIAGFKTADGTLITNDFVTLTFPSSNGFDCFEPGDVVQGYTFDQVTDKTESLIIFDYNGDQPVDKTGRSWIGPSITPEEDLNAPANFPTNKRIDLKSIGSYYKTNSKITISNGIIDMFVYVDSGLGGFTNIPLRVYRNSSTGALQFCYNGGCVGFMDEDVPGSGNALLKDFGNLNVGYHHVQLIIANNQITCFDNGVEKGSAVASGGDLVLDVFGGDPRLSGNTETTGFYFYAFNVLSDPNFSYDGEFKVISKDADATPPTITVDGGDWRDSTQFNYTELIETTSNSIEYPTLFPNPPVIFEAGDTASTFIGAFTAATIKLPLPGISGTILGIKNGAQGGSISFTNTLYYKDGTSVPMSNSQTGYNEVTLDGSKEVDYILVEGSATASGSQGLSIYGLQIDGVQIVDTGSGDNKLVKETPYDTKLTVAGPTDLADMTGSTIMTDGTGAPGPYTQTPYKLVTTDIESINDTDPANVVLTFPGAVSTNPDLQYFRAGDVVQEQYTFDDIYGQDVVPYPSDREWSAPEYRFGTFNSTSEERHRQVFDGDITNNGNGPINTSDAIAGYNIDPPLPNIVRVRAASRTGAAKEGNFIINIGGQDVSTPRKGAQANLIEVWSGPPSSLSSVAGQRGGTAGGSMAAWEVTVDTPEGNKTYFLINKAFITNVEEVKVISTGYPDSNTMVVDGGEWLGTDGSATDGVDLGWNQSETWTDYATNANFSKVFDGNDATYVANIGNPVTYTYTGKLTGKVEVTIGNFKNLLGSGETYELNSSGNVVTISPTEFDVWKEIGTLDDEAMSITITGLSGNSALISGIKVDGQRLVDPTIAGAPTPIGDNHVEYQTNGGQGDIISTDPNTNTLVIADTGDRDNRWIKGFSVAGPSVIDTPLLTNDVELRGSDFATTPADADTLKEIVWSINGTEYSAGVTNPWSPLEKLPTNSTVTVKVKYKGNTLEDSDWSPDVTFTTGSTMRSLFSRIAALEANDVTDDATDTALLTLIAGLAARIQALEEAN